MISARSRMLSNLSDNQYGDFVGIIKDSSSPRLETGEAQTGDFKDVGRFSDEEDEFQNTSID